VKIRITPALSNPLYLLGKEAITSPYEPGATVIRSYRALQNGIKTVSGELDNGIRLSWYINK
jgi:hypothetical protein